MKKLNKISKEYYVRQIVACWLIFCMLVIMPARVAMAIENPLPDALPDTIIDSVGINTPVIDNINDIMDITQTASEAIVNWNTFDIGSDATVNFLQPSVDAAVLNRVHDGNITGIMGTLNANGGVYIVNPAGILFGSGSTVNVTQLVASSLEIEDGDFLNGMPYTFTGGVEAGNVTNNGTITAEVIALIGKNVINRCSLNTEGDRGELVIMAAGDSVLVSEVGSSIVVEVAIAELANPDDYQVNHESGSIYAQDVIMAAGDIWSSAYVSAEGDEGASVKMDAEGDLTIDEEIYVYADGGSDATVTVDLDAGNDITISGNVYAEAYIDSGNPADDAFATIDIDAGRDVFINDYVEAYAYTYDGSGNATAGVAINATGDVEINSYFKSRAEAVDSGNATSDTRITGENIDIYSNVNARAITDNSGAAKGNIDITARGDLYVDGRVKSKVESLNDSGTATSDIKMSGVNISIDDYVTSRAISYDSGNATAGIDIDASGSVYVYDRVKAHADGEGVFDSTAGITIEADGNVEVTATDYSEASIYAEADDGINNKASVDVTAGEHVKVTADGYNSFAGIEAEVYSDYYPEGTITNAATLSIDAGGNVLAEATNGGEVDIDAEAYGGTNNTTTTTIVAGGYVWAHADGSYEGKYSDAAIEAEAHDGTNTNKANLYITTTGEYDSEDERDGDVLAIADNGGVAEIMALADPDGEGLPTAVNTANVVINSVDDVEVVAYNSDDHEDVLWDASIAAWATEGKINTADIKINAGGDVIVKGYGEASSGAIDAAAWNDDIELWPGQVLDGLVNTAKVEITAESVEVRSEDGGESMISAYAMNSIDINAYLTRSVVIEDIEATLGSIKNDADIVITTTNDDDGDPVDRNGYVVDQGDVLAIDYYGGEEGGGGIDAEAFNVITYDDYYPVDLTVQGPIENSADILINAADDVSVIAVGDCSYGDTEIDSEAWNDVVGGSAYYINLIEEGSIVNSSGVDVRAGDDVVVRSDYGWAALGAHSWNYSEAPLPDIFPDVKTNTATVMINAGGDVEVSGYYGSAGIEAGTEFATNNTSLVDIDAVGGVYVSDIGGYGEDYSGIRAIAQTAVNSNSADVQVDAGKVEVFAGAEGNAAITADARYAYNEDSENSASIEINTHEVIVEAPEEPDGEIITIVRQVDDFDGYDGDVKVIGVERSEASIDAITEDGYTNTSDILLCTDGGVTVDSYYGEADITAEATYGYSNTSTVGIGARGDDGVLVRSSGFGFSFIESRAHDGYINTAETVVCTAGDVIVLDEGGEQANTAGILAEAIGGNFNDAYVGVCADGDVIVGAGFTLEDMEEGIIPEEGTGGHALIKAEATPYGDDIQLITADISQVDEEPTTANAETVVVSLDGGVAVIDATGYVVGTAEISAEAYGAAENTASVGVSAGGDLLDEEHPSYELTEGIGVLVAAFGDYSNAKIISETYNGLTNTSDTVVCTPGEVVVSAEGYWSLAKIKSLAESGEVNTATTQVYASDVDVDVPGLYRGNGIWAYADLDTNPRLPADFIMTEYDGEFGIGEFVWIEEEEEGDSIASLLIRDYSDAQDCPDCPGCPCGEAPLLAPVAPLVEFDFPRIAGCPALTQAAAAELGIPEETLQIGIGNALALNPSIQPCQACATLMSAATILRDEDGSRMAAMVQTFNTLAPADAPFSPEMATSIATALGDAAEGTQYASAMEYIDAFVQYVAALDTGLGTPVGDSVAYVLEKYGAGVTDNANSNIAAFIASQLESSATF